MRQSGKVSLPKFNFQSTCHVSVIIYLTECKKICKADKIEKKMFSCFIYLLAAEMFSLNKGDYIYTHHMHISYRLFIKMLSEKYNYNIPVKKILSCRSFQDGGDALKIKLRKDRKVDFETICLKVIDSEGDFDQYLPITYKYVEKYIQPLRTY